VTQGRLLILINKSSAAVHNTMEAIMVKKLITLVIITALTLGGVGCMNSEISQSGMSRSELAIAHLEEKYGVEFEYVSPWGSTYAQGGVTKMVVVSESLPGEEIMVSVIPEGDGYIVRDNYLAVKYKEETRLFLLEKAEEIFGEAKVFYELSNSTNCETLSATLTFEEFIASSDITVALRGYIIINEENFDSKEQSYELGKLVIESGAKIQFLEIIILSSEDYNAIGDAWQTFNSFLDDKENIKSETVAIIRQRNSEINVEWEEYAYNE
jgi:hypothetical protein